MFFLVDTGRLVLAAVTSVFFLFLTIAFGSGSFWLPAAICLVLFAIYAVLAFRNGQIVRITPEFVQLRFFGKPRQSFSWTEVQEVGIAGTKVLNAANPDRTGAKYIYFSPRAMTEDERFHMCLKWPPRDIIYVRYSADRIDRIMKCWRKEIVLYNTGKLQL